MILTADSNFPNIRKRSSRVALQNTRDLLMRQILLTGLTSQLGQDLQQILSPTDVVTQLLLKFSLEITGTYYFPKSGVTSWYNVAVTIFEKAKQLDFPLNMECRIAITTTEYPILAQQPAYSALLWEKVLAVLGTHPPHWRQGLRQMLEEFCNYTYNYTYESNYSQRW